MTTTATEVTTTDLATTVMGLYEAFGRGDIEHILSAMSDEISWDEGIRRLDVPYLQPGRGKAHVQQFFVDLAANVEFTTFEPLSVCAGADTVMAAIREEGRNLVTGGHLREDVAVHIWTFGPDGLVTSFRHVGDFAIHEHAAQATA